jgi:outer membrane protein TolC
MLSLSGSIGEASFRQAGRTSEGVTWALGPLAVSLPIFDGGRIAGNTTAAVAAYDDAVVQLQSKARQAVREVEEALVNLSSIGARTPDVEAAAAGYSAALTAAQARYRAGLASLVELEDARRTALFAQQNTLALERDRIAAWIALYRAAGGGWQSGAPIAAAAPQP